MDSINQIFEFDMLPLVLTVASFVGVLVLLFVYGAVIQPILIRKGILKQRINYTTRAEAIELIDQFIAGQCLPGEVDDFTYETFEDSLGA
jgi:nucleoside permease NupC